MSIWEEVQQERARQTEKWGGSGHDDAHTRNDWVAFIAYHAGLASYKADFREQMLRVAALAVAAVEAYDRYDREASEDSTAATVPVLQA